LTKETCSTLSETYHSATCSPQAPMWFALRCTQNKRLSLTYLISHLHRI